MSTRTPALPILIILLVTIAVVGGVWQATRPKKTPAEPVTGIVDVVAASDLPPESPVIHRITGGIAAIRGATLQVRISEVREETLVERLVLAETTSATRIVEVDPSRATIDAAGTTTQPEIPIPLAGLQIGDTVTIVTEANIKEENRFPLTEIERIKR